MCDLRQDTCLFGHGRVDHARTQVNPGVFGAFLHCDNCEKNRHRHLHPKTLFEIAMVLSTNRDSFPSNSHVSATFSILLRFGESWSPTNCEKFTADGSQMGRTNFDKSVW